MTDDHDQLECGFYLQINTIKKFQVRQTLAETQV